MTIWLCNCHVFRVLSLIHSIDYNPACARFQLWTRWCLRYTGTWRFYWAVFLRQMQPTVSPGPPWTLSVIMETRLWMLHLKGFSHYLTLVTRKWNKNHLKLLFERERKVHVRRTQVELKQWSGLGFGSIPFSPTLFIYRLIQSRFWSRLTEVRSAKNSGRGKLYFT